MKKKETELNSFEMDIWKSWMVKWNMFVGCSFLGIYCKRKWRKIFHFNILNMMMWIPDGVIKKFTPSFMSWCLGLWGEVRWGGGCVTRSLLGLLCEDVGMMVMVMMMMLTLVLLVVVAACNCNSMYTLFLVSPIPLQSSFLAHRMDMWRKKQWYEYPTDKFIHQIANNLCINIFTANFHFDCIFISQCFCVSLLSRNATG